MLLPYRPVTHLKAWAPYIIDQDVATAGAEQLIKCMRANIVSFRFEDAPAFTGIMRHYVTSISRSVKLLGPLFVDRDEVSSRSVSTVHTVSKHHRRTKFLNLHILLRGKQPSVKYANARLVLTEILRPLSLQVIQFDNAMANERTCLEQRGFAVRLGHVFQLLCLVSVGFQIDPLTHLLSHNGAKSLKMVAKQYTGEG